MPLISLAELLQAVRERPLFHLTSRRLRSLNMLLTGRDLALQHLGADEWGDLPIAERVEQHYGVQTKAWRNWTDIVEFFADDEGDALERFLSLARDWNDRFLPHRRRR